METPRPRKSATEESGYAQSSAGGDGAVLLQFTVSVTGVVRASVPETAFTITVYVPGFVPGCPEFPLVLLLPLPPPQAISSPRSTAPTASVARI